MSDILADFVKMTQPAAEPAVVEAQPEAKKEAAPSEQPKAAEEPKKETSKASTPEGGPVDLQTPDEEETKPEAFDFDTFVKDIGAEVKTKDEFKTKWKELLTKEDPLKGLPANVRKAVEFALKGGDIHQMLKVNSVDYSQIDPVTVYENYVLSKATDKAKAKEYLDSLAPIAKEMEGQRLKEQYTRWQDQQEAELKAALDAKAASELAKRVENEKRLREAIDKVNEIKGFKVKDKFKEKFYKTVQENRLTSELFFNDKGEYDYEKIMRLKFINDNFDYMDQYYKDRITAETKRDMIKEDSNIQIDKPSGVVQLEQQEKDPLLRWSAHK